MKDLELRDYFAVEAMKGLLSYLPADGKLGGDVLSKGAYSIADYMLAERNKN